jgi:hypothetical protein
MSDVSPQFQPAEEQLRETLREVLARPDYQVDPLAEPSDGMLQLLATLLRWLLTPFKWLFDFTDGLPDFLRWLIVVVLAVVLVAILVHIGWTLMQAMSGGRRPRRGAALPSELVSVELTVTELEQAADQAFNEGVLIEAVRFLFRAALTGLSDREKKKFRRGMTNRQYLNHFRHTSLLPHLQIFVSTIELKWYGDEPCESHDYNECRGAYQQIMRLLRGGSHVDAS